MKNTRFLSIILCFFGVFAQCQGLAKPSVKVGYFELAPHGLRDKTGAAIDYFNMIAKELDWDVTFVPTPLARMMSTDESDAILYLGKNPEREKKFVFSDLPLLQMQGGIAVSKSNALNKVTSAKDLLQLSIGAWLAGYRSPLMQNKDLNLVDYPGEAVSKRALQMIAKGRLDAFYCPEIISLNHTIQKSELNGKLKVLQLPEPPTGLYIVFSKKFPEARIREFNIAHAKIEKKIPYKSFLKGYLAVKK